MFMRNEAKMTNKKKYLEATGNFKVKLRYNTGNFPH